MRLRFALSPDPLRSMSVPATPTSSSVQPASATAVGGSEPADAGRPGELLGRHDRPAKNRDQRDESRPNHPADLRMRTDSRR